VSLTLQLPGRSSTWMRNHRECCPTWAPADTCCRVNFGDDAADDEWRDNSAATRITIGGLVHEGSVGGSSSGL
jgi:hypothetical protein